MATPHDALFKRVFSQPRHAAGELRHLLPPAVVAQIDWETLTLVPASVVDPQHRDRHADLLYSVEIARQSVFLYLLFEHKSWPDALTPLQLLVYVVRIWEGFLAENPGAKKLPLILPIVVHHGDRRWTVGTDLRELIQIPAGLEKSLQPILPSFPFLLDDLTSESSDALRERTMTAMARVTLFCLQRAKHSGNILSELSLWTDTIRSMFAAPGGATALNDVFVYISQVTHLPDDEILQFLSVEVGPESEQLLKTTWEQLLERGRAEGRAEGQAEGRAEGQAEGRAEGQARVLLQQLAQRFGTLPADVTERVRAASVEELDVWAGNILGANNLEEVFGTG